MYIPRTLPGMPAYATAHGPNLDNQTHIPSLIRPLDMKLTLHRIRLIPAATPHASIPTSRESRWSLRVNMHASLSASMYGVLHTSTGVFECGSGRLNFAKFNGTPWDLHGTRMGPAWDPHGTAWDP